MLAKKKRQNAMTIEHFEDIQPDDRIEIEQTVATGSKSYKIKIRGTVIRVVRHKLRSLYNFGVKVYSTILLRRLSDGDITKIVVDKSIVIRHA